MIMESQKLHNAETCPNYVFLVVTLHDPCIWIHFGVKRIETIPIPQCVGSRKKAKSSLPKVFIVDFNMGLIFMEFFHKIPIPPCSVVLGVEGGDVSK